VLDFAHIGGKMDAATHGASLLSPVSPSKALDTACPRWHPRLEQMRNMEMPSHSRDVTTAAERRFPVRIRVAIPPLGFGQRLPPHRTRPDLTLSAIDARVRKNAIATAA
jgi:hypothetical protein